MPDPNDLELANATDVGRHRSHNEDNTAIDPEIGFAMVADGMGGYKAGEVASAIAVASILAEVKRNLAVIQSTSMHDTDGYSRESLLIKGAINTANLAIFRIAQSNPRCERMGTTVVSMLFYGNQFSVAHVGDSRLYRLRAETLEQITSDHSLVQELINRGFYTPEEAAANTPKNLLTRALGIAEQVQIDLYEDITIPGDIYLMCTDGLHDIVNDEEIHLTLCKYSVNLAQAARELVQKANEAGGRDNISVVLARPLNTQPGVTESSETTEWFM